ncbi:hypothetical protein ACWC9U_35165 [Streptomyces sp. 900116325]
MAPSAFGTGRGAVLIRRGHVRLPGTAVGTRESAGTAVLLRGTASSLTTGSGRANNGA